jgi:hypothetical protein
MILNIIDGRKRRYRWTRVKAIIEPTWHDNSCKDADHASPCGDELDYDERLDISVSDAIKWAADLNYYVTLYVYDVDNTNRYYFEGNDVKIMND